MLPKLKPSGPIATVLIILILPIILLLIPAVIFYELIPGAGKLCIFFGLTTLLINMSLGDYGDGTYKSRSVTDIIALVALSFVFGFQIYGQIPFQYGGGSAYKIIVINLKDLPQLQPDPTCSDTLRVIYENDDILLLKRANEEVFVLQKRSLKNIVY